MASSDDEAASFASSEFLLARIRAMLEFWSEAGFDRRLGRYVSARDTTGRSIPAPVTTISTARFLYMFATGLHLGFECCGEAAERCLTQLQEAWDSVHGGFFWDLDARDRGEPSTRKVTYAQAFALLGTSAAVAAGLASSDTVANIVETIETHLGDRGHPLLVEEASPDWSFVPAYRGQNANMHMCEAYLEAFEAIGDYALLHRAQEIASAVGELMDSTGGLVWEHYDSSWHPDWLWTWDGTTAMYHPSGFVPGHWLEWAKLFLALGATAGPEDAARLRERARALYVAAWSRAWDERFGGFVYTLDRNLEVMDVDKHHWPQAEGIAAAARLADTTGERRFLDDYGRIWSYVLESFVTSEGAWRKRLDSSNSSGRSVVGDPLEPDYHSLGACYTALHAVARGGPPSRREAGEGC